MIAFVLTMILFLVIGPGFVPYDSVSDKRWKMGAQMRYFKSLKKKSN